MNTKVYHHTKVPGFSAAPQPGHTPAGEVLVSNQARARPYAPSTPVRYFVVVPLALGRVYPFDPKIITLRPHHVMLRLGSAALRLEGWRPANPCSMSRRLAGARQRE